MLDLNYSLLRMTNKQSNPCHVNSVMMVCITLGLRVFTVTEPAKNLAILSGHPMLKTKYK